MSDKPSVHEALAAVMAELPAIGKDNKSPEGYQYRGIEAVTKQVQPLFARHGIVVAPKAEVISITPSPAMKDGWQDVLLQVEWTITGPDGSTLTAQTNGMGRDRSDKGVNKAQTQAFKYLLLHVLCIADAKDDADSHTYEHDRQETVPQWKHLRWPSQEAMTAAHDEFSERAASYSEEKKDDTKRYRKSCGYPWPMSAEQLADMTDYLDAIDADAAEAESA